MCTYDPQGMSLCINLEVNWLDFFKKNVERIRSINIYMRIYDACIQYVCPPIFCTLRVYGTMHGIEEIVL